MSELPVEDDAIPRRYTYSPFSRDDQIRILQIHPVNAHIECRIRQVSYHQQKYYALSYVWGDLTTQFSAVIVDDSGISLGRFPLTQNLKSAIEDIRASTIRNKSFWIDQVCINQLDLEERGSQVRLMGKIYSHAERVITYDGPDTDEY